MITIVANCKTRDEATAAQQALKNLGISCASVLLDLKDQPATPIIRQYSATNAWADSACACTGTYHIPIKGEHPVLRLSMDVDDVPQGSLMRVDGGHIPPPFSGKYVTLFDKAGKSSKMLVTGMSYGKNDDYWYWEVKLEKAEL